LRVDAVTKLNFYLACCPARAPSNPARDSIDSGVNSSSDERALTIFISSIGLTL